MKNNSGPAPDDRRTSRRNAVALRYRPDEDKAPKVVATGGGHLAEKILEFARTHGIPIREDPDLVEVLCHLDLNQAIPAEIYPVVAEILAFVYRTAQSYRREMAESYQRLGDQRFAEGDAQGAGRSWFTAAGIFDDLGEIRLAAQLRNRVQQTSPSRSAPPQGTITERHQNPAER